MIRVRPGQPPFMQKNLPKYTPDWVQTGPPSGPRPSQAGGRYPLCNDRRTLLWFANQRAVEYHPTLMRSARTDEPTHLILDLDPPAGSDFAGVVAAARLVQQALADTGLAGAVKTSGAKGVHVFVPLADGTVEDDVAAATRALAARAERLDPRLATTAYMLEDREGKVFVDSTRSGGATVVAAYSPRVRPGAPVSFPVAWDDLDDVHPRDFTVRTAAALLGDSDPWRDAMPEPQTLPADLLAEGQEIPIARVAAMHEGKRRPARRPGRLNHAVHVRLASVDFAPGPFVVRVSASGPTAPDPRRPYAGRPRTRRRPSCATPPPARASDSRTSPRGSPTTGPANCVAAAPLGRRGRGAAGRGARAPATD